MRIQHRREFYIPKGALKFADRESSAVVYAYTNSAGKPALIGFHGRAQKPDFRFWYRNVADREAKARRFFESQRIREGFVKEQAAKRQARGRGLEVGDVLRSSWGYDQTNVDYYQVTALIGSKMVEIREIAQEAEYCGQAMAGKCVPVLGKFIGKPMRKVALDGAVRIASYASAFKVEPKLIGGVPVFDAARFSSYA